MKKIITAVFIIFVFVVNSCKKIDPDCATCPCPACPRITEITPDHGRPGDTLILRGANFNEEDPSLNIITFNDTNAIVQEILEYTATELKIIVPEGATTGAVKIKINDERALSSDEIPEYDKPKFTLDHFVELVAGIPEQAGDDDGSLLDATFRDPFRIDVNDLGNIVVAEPGPKRIREIANDNVTTKYQDNSILGIYDVAYAQNAIYFTDLVSTSSFGYRINFLQNSNPTVFYNSTSTNRIREIIGIKEKVNKILLIKTNGAKNHVCMKELIFPIEDTLKTLISSLNFLNDLEIINDDIYISIDRSIVKLNAQNNYSIDTIFSTSDPATIPFGIAISNKGDVYFSKIGHHQIFKVTDKNTFVPIAGMATSGYNTNATFPLLSQFKNIADIDFDKDNNLYIVDAGNYCIRRLKID